MGVWHHGRRGAEDGASLVTSEILPDGRAAFTLPRLTKVVAGEDPGGITKSAGWEGGGGFRTVTVGPSMYEDTPSVSSSRSGQRTVASLGRSPGSSASSSRMTRHRCAGSGADALGRRRWHRRS